MDIQREITCTPVFNKRGFPATESEQTCFVIMPFSGSAIQDVYISTVKPIVESLGIRCIRGDDIFSVGSIMEDIWVALCSSTFVIGEFTGRNPNVLYEAGIAHTLGKPIIALTQHIDDIPFDFRHLRHIVYNTTPSGYKDLATRITKTIEALQKDPWPLTPRPHRNTDEELNAMREAMLEQHSSHSSLLFGIEARIMRQHRHYHTVLSNLLPPINPIESDAYIESLAFKRVDSGEVSVDFYSQQKVVTLGVEITPEFFITKYPITNLQYRQFLLATGHPHPETWVNGNIPRGLENHPAVGVSWVDVNSYCDWLSSISNKEIKIPSEAMWLQSAGYGKKQLYPWGENWHDGYCNSREYGLGTSSPANEFEGIGDSPYGCTDMLGNLWEWTISLSDTENSGFHWRAVRGGANYTALQNIGVLARLWANPGHFLFVRDLCFRVVYDAV